MEQLEPENDLELNLKAIRIQVIYLSLLKENSDIAFITEETIFSKLRKYQNSSDLLRSIIDSGIFLQVTTFQIMTTLFIVYHQYFKTKSKIEEINGIICRIHMQVLNTEEISLVIPVFMLVVVHCTQILLYYNAFKHQFK